MPLQKIVECCDDYGAGSLDDAATSNLEAANAAAVSEIHLYVRGLYAVPFDPVPDEIGAIAAQLTKVHLYYRRGLVPGEVQALHQRLQEHLRGITASTFRIGTDGGDAEAAAQGPRVSASSRRFGQGFMGELLDD
jgi:hypothetical protein